jgi:signal transduction histidine kinase
MAHAAPDQEPAMVVRSARKARRFFWPGGLSSRLLILTALFVILAQLLILAPILASFEERWLSDRVRLAELASTAVDGAPGRKVSRALSKQLLEGAGVVSIAVQSDGVRRLLLEAPRMDKPPYLVDLRDRNPIAWLSAPFQTLFGGDDQMVRVVAVPRFRDGEFVEIVAPDKPLRDELWAYMGRLLAVTVFISAVAGGLVYISLNAFLVRPMQKITRAMEKFRADPEDPDARIGLSGRRDEVGRAEAELDRMQIDLRLALSSKARLAALGEAVAKINHDLRNMLTSAQMASERLAQLGDPRVSQALPRLERALDRAVTLATEVLAYGKTQEAMPVPIALSLLTALEAAAEDAGLGEPGVGLQTSVPASAQIMADPDQLHRILLNLLRNAREAIEAANPDQPTGLVTVDWRQDEQTSLIRVTDTGPGVPERVRANLFQPFAGSGRAGGTGLGLAIARELAQAHGGELSLVDHEGSGASFELRLPGSAKTLKASKAQKPKATPSRRGSAPPS